MSSPSSTPIPSPVSELSDSDSVLASDSSEDEAHIRSTMRIVESESAPPVPQKVESKELCVWQQLTHQLHQAEINLFQRVKKHWFDAQAAYETRLWELIDPCIKKLLKTKRGWVRCTEIGKMIKTGYMLDLPVHCLHYGPQPVKNRVWTHRLQHRAAPAFRRVQYRLYDRGYLLLDVSKDTFVKIVLCCVPIQMYTPPPLWHRLNIIC